MIRTRLRQVALAALIVAGAAAPGSAQVTPAAGYTPPDDTPSIKVGVTIFADYTVQQEPKIKDADGNEVTFNAFQIGRSYINVTGNISHSIVFRLTPDITRETGVGSSLNGSYTFRLKYAYAQWNLDDYMTQGLVRALRHAAESVLRLLRGHLSLSLPGARRTSSARAISHRRTSAPRSTTTCRRTTATSRPASSTARTTTGPR